MHVISINDEGEGDDSEKGVRRRRTKPKRVSRRSMCRRSRWRRLESVRESAEEGT